MVTMRWTVGLMGLVGCVACAGTPPAAKSPNDGAPPPAGVQGNAKEEAGASCASAIALHASDETAGVQAEYDWLGQHYPGYRTDSQALIDCSGKSADLLTITTAQGEQRKVYFDISEFFGKL